MERPWLEHYPPGVPADIDPRTHSSLASLIADCVVRWRGKDAFANRGTRMSYERFDELSLAFAAFLHGRLGLRKGDRIAIMLPNVLQYPVAMYGALRAGLVVVNVNPLYSPRELRHQMDDAEASAILILADVSRTLGEVLEGSTLRHVVVTQSGDLLEAGPPDCAVDPRLRGCIAFRDALREGATLELPRIDLTRDDLAYLQYTGGTTGLSKGAMLTHGNMVANALQMLAIFLPRCVPGNEIYVTALPLYHVFALTVNCIGCLHLGGLNVLITNPRDMPGFVQELGRWRFTFISGVNTLFNGLLHTPGFGNLDFSALRITLSGGMALQSSVAKRWHEVTGVPALEGYGLSETAPCLTCNPMTATEYSGTIGLPLPSTDIRIRDDAGNDLPPDMPGELCARGPQVMAGYWRKPEETRAVMTPDGYFRTGDIATMDAHGFVRIVDRKKDMIIVSGFNVYPNEVEDVVAAMDGVLECACIGVPDERCGEVVMLFVVPKPGAAPGAQRIRDDCRGKLAPYKIPQRVEFIDAIPKTTVGKLLRRELRNRVK
ncbi:MAG TPA: AMP-binding protein [Gammaproteobacteria bacterium]